MKSMKNVKAKLRDIVSKQGINSLENISFSRVKQWLGSTDYETEKIIEYLFKNRIIEKKYVFYCDCGERIIVTHHKLISDKGCICENCEKCKSVSEIISNSEIIYKIYKDYLDECVESERDKIIESNEGKHMDDSNEIRVFMGSSTEAKGFMEEIAEYLEDMDGKRIKPITWNDGEVFLPGRNTIDSLTQMTKNVQAAIFIFSADDKMWNDTTKIINSSSDIVRDNVLFEYGLFLGALNKSRVCFVCKGNPKLASDLKGITYIDGEKGRYGMKSLLKTWIENFE